MRCNNCGRRIGRHERVTKSWDDQRGLSLYLCPECAAPAPPGYADVIFTRGVFLFVCGAIALSAILLLIWSSRQGPPAEYYSFTNIKAEPWHKAVCIPPLLVVGVATLIITSKKLPS